MLQQFENTQYGSSPVLNILKFPPKEEYCMNYVYGIEPVRTTEEQTYSKEMDTLMKKFNIHYEEALKMN